MNIDINQIIQLLGEKDIMIMQLRQRIVELEKQLAPVKEAN